MPDTTTKADRRLAWWLVWAYPPRFRRDVGLGLADAIEDRMAARRAAGASSPGVWVPAILESLVDSVEGPSRFLALLLGFFAGIALLLAAVGIYGVTSYGVAQRTHEIGIRLALGASGDRVLREVVARGVRLTVVAVAIDLACAVALGRLAAAVLFGVTATDPGALAGAAVILALVSVAASYIPARRASRVDPVVALADD